jgi:ABC-type glycerol-3-phosphate transport system substrate-binding protein
MKLLQIDDANSIVARIQIKVVKVTQKISFIFQSLTRVFCYHKFVNLYLFAFFLLSCTEVFGEELKILVMPIESNSTTNKPFFSKEESETLYPNLTFENNADWNDLGIGYHRWLCGELDKFAKENKDLKIHIWFISWDRALHEISSYWSQYDVIQVPSTWTAFLAEQQILSKIIDEPNYANYPVNLLGTCYPEGSTEIYAIPWQIDIRLLFYRSELAKDPVELSDFDSFSRCLQSLQEQTKLSSGTITKPLGISLSHDWDIVHNVFRYFFGGKIIEKRDNKWIVAFRDEKAIKGLQKLWTISCENLVSFDTSENKSGSPSWHKMAEGLVNKRYYAVFGGLYMRTVFDKYSDINISAAQLPRIGTVESHTFLGGCHLGITNIATQQGRRPLAMKLINHLTSKKIGIDMFKHTEAIPANLEAFKEYFKSDHRLQNLDPDDILSHAEPYPSMAKWAIIIERNIGLDEFYKVLQSIAEPREWNNVVAELESAASQLEQELEPQIPTRPHVPLITPERISVVLGMVILAATIVIIRKLMELKKSLDYYFQDLKVYVVQTVPTIRQELQIAENQILDTITNVPSQLKELFQRSLEQLTVLQSGINEISEGTSLTKNKLDSFFSCIDLLITDINTINKQTGTTNINLENIREWAEECYFKLDKVYKKLLPETFLSENSKLIVDIKYIEERVKSEFRLYYNVKYEDDRENEEPDWTWEFDSQEISLFFELMALRMFYSGEYEKNNDQQKTYIYLSDYYLLKYPKFGAIEVLIDTTSHFFRSDIRQIVYKALPPNYIITDKKKNSQSVSQDRFMFQSISRSKSGPSKIYPFDEKRHTSDARKGAINQEINSEIKPWYEFILPQQVKIFQCNFFETIKKLEEMASKVKVSDDICKLIRECERCLPIWNLLLKFDCDKLSQDNKKFIEEHKKMIDWEIMRYKKVAEYLEKNEEILKTLDFNENLTDKVKLNNAIKERIKQIRKFGEMWEAIAQKLT